MLSLFVIIYDNRMCPKNNLLSFSFGKGPLLFHYSRFPIRFLYRACQVVISFWRWRLDGEEGLIYDLKIFDLIFFFRRWWKGKERKWSESLAASKLLPRFIKPQQQHADELTLFPKVVKRFILPILISVTNSTMVVRAYDAPRYQIYSRSRFLASTSRVVIS